MSDPVDVAPAEGISRGGAALTVWVHLLAGPVIWFGHFMAVYLLAEAACTGDGVDAAVLGLHVVSFVTLAATVAAATATLVAAALAYQRRRHGDDREVVGAGFLLSLLSCIAVLFVGLPALVLPSC